MIPHTRILLTQLLRAKPSPVSARLLAELPATLSLAGCLVTALIDVSGQKRNKSLASGDVLSAVSDFGLNSVIGSGSVPNGLATMVLLKMTKKCKSNSWCCGSNYPVLLSRSCDEQSSLSKVLQHLEHFASLCQLPSTNEARDLIRPTLVFKHSTAGYCHQVEAPGTP